MECNFETISDYASASRSLICVVCDGNVKLFPLCSLALFSDFHLHTIRDCTWIFPATDLCVGSDEASLKLAEKKFRAHNWNTIHDHGRPPWTPSVGSISKSDSSWITQGTQKRLKIDRLPPIESLRAAHCETVIFQLSHLVHFQLNHSPAKSSTEWIKMIVKFNERWARVSLMKIVCFNLHSAHNFFIKL